MIEWIDKKARIAFWTYSRESLLILTFDRIAIVLIGSFLFACIFVCLCLIKLYQKTDYYGIIHVEGIIWIILFKQF